MKKITVIIMLSLLVFTFVGCNKDNRVDEQSLRTNETLITSAKSTAITEDTEITQEEQVEMLTSFDFKNSKEYYDEIYDYTVVYPSSFVELNSEEYDLTKTQETVAFRVDKLGSVFTLATTKTDGITTIEEYENIIMSGMEYELMDKFTINNKKYLMIQGSLSESPNIESTQLLTVHGGYIHSLSIKKINKSKVDSVETLKTIVSLIEYGDVVYSDLVGTTFVYPGLYDIGENDGEYIIKLSENEVSYEITDITQYNTNLSVVEYVNKWTSYKGEQTNVLMNEENWLCVKSETGQETYVFIKNGIAYKFGYKHLTENNDDYSIFQSIIESVVIKEIPLKADLSSWVVYGNDYFTMYYPNTSEATIEENTGYISLIKNELVMNYNIVDLEDTSLKVFTEVLAESFTKNAVTESMDVYLSDGEAVKCNIINDTDALGNEYIHLLMIVGNKGYQYSFESVGGMIGIKEDIISLLISNLSIHNQSENILKDVTYSTFSHDLFVMSMVDDASFFLPEKGSYEVELSDENVESSSTGQFVINNEISVVYTVNVSENKTLESMTEIFKKDGFETSDYNVSNIDKLEIQAIKAWLDDGDTYTEMIAFKQNGLNVVFMFNTSNHLKEISYPIWDFIKNSILVK